MQPPAIAAQAKPSPLNPAPPGAQVAAKITAPQLSKLRKAAGEFEAMLLESLWKSMKETFKDPNDPTDPTLESFDDWGIHAMASAVGDSGGLGIKNMILKYLEPTVDGGNGSSKGTT